MMHTAKTRDSSSFSMLGEEVCVLQPAVVIGCWMYELEAA